MKIITVTMDGNVEGVLVLNDDTDHNQIIDNLNVAAASAPDGGKGVYIKAMKPSTYQELLDYVKTV